MVETGQVYLIALASRYIDMFEFLLTKENMSFALTDVSTMARMYVKHSEVDVEEAYSLTISEFLESKRTHVFCSDADIPDLVERAYKADAVEEVLDYFEYLPIAVIEAMSKVNTEEIRKAFAFG